MRPGTVLVLIAGALAGCELQEVTTATPADFAVAEVVLIAGADSQYAYLHRSVGQGSALVTGATVAVTDEATGRALVFAPVPATRCLSPAPQDAEAAGSCYAADSRSLRILPGSTYRLHISLRDGMELTGRTKVPGTFRLLHPRATPCALPPDTTLELRWTQAKDAWVYDVDAVLQDIFPILVARGVIPDTANVPLRVQGLAIAAADTTLVLPSELGLFDRFDDKLHPIMLALQGGFPAGVSAEVMIAAADRNYVNWARGGGFNPSGVVRVPSVRGGGTGVFGAINPARFSLRVTRESSLPSCL